MKTQLQIFTRTALVTALLITTLLFISFKLHANIHISLQLLSSGKTIILILVSVLLLSAMASLIYSKFWLKPLKALEEENTIIAENPDQILAPPPELNAPIALVEAQSRLRVLYSKVRQSIRQRQRLADAGEAVAKINHDLRNMLSSILLVTNQLESSEDPKVAQVAPVVIRATEQATKLCQNMLDYLSELPPPSPENLHMPALMEDLAAATDIKLDYSGPEILVTDRLILYRIFLNLFRNAQDAGAKNIAIDIWQAGHLAVIDISDNGPGIDDKIKDRIFSAFTSGRSSHIGLGLAICLDLALALEGRLNLARSSNEGSAFRLQLPETILALK